MVSGVGKAVEVSRAQPTNRQRIGKKRGDDVGDLVGGAVGDQVADHVERLEQVFLELPSRMSRAMPSASPGMLENIRLMWTSSR